MTNETIAAANRAIAEAQARLHDIGGTAAERAHIQDLVTQRDALVTAERLAARRAAREAREDARWDRVNPDPETVEEQIADLDAHYPGGFRAWYMGEDDEFRPVPSDDDIPF
jgi:hypothetical protein